MKTHMPKTTDKKSTIMTVGRILVKRTNNEFDPPNLIGWLLKAICTEGSTWTPVTHMTLTDRVYISVAYTCQTWRAEKVVMGGFGWVLARRWITDSHGSQRSSCPKPWYGSSSHDRTPSLRLNLQTPKKKTVCNSKFAPEEAMKAQRESRGIVLLFL